MFVLQPSGPCIKEHLYSLLEGMLLHFSIKFAVTHLYN